MNRFRNFDRATVISIMQSMDYLPLLAGAWRKTDPGKVMDFDTFDTLVDPVEYFAEAMNTELEHGPRANSATDVTGGDALKTAKIAAAHLSGFEYGVQNPEPFPTYYDFLWWMESLHSAALAKHASRVPGTPSPLAASTHSFM